MRILDRYLLREFLGYAALGLGSFVALFVVVDLFEKLDVFVDNRTAPWTVFKYYANGLPTILTEVLPIAMLLGALLGLSALRKHNEVAAMQSSGESPWRLARPLLLAALIVSIGQYAMNELIGPQSYARQRRILVEEIKRQSDADRESRTEVRLLGAHGRFWVAQFYDAKNASLRRVSLQVLRQPELALRIDAESARYAGHVWSFTNGWYRTFHDSTEAALRFRTYGTSGITEQPSDFARSSEDPFHMSMKNLYTFAHRVQESGGDVQKHLTNFHIRASFPLANLVMVLLGTALSLRVIRGGNIALGFGISVSVGFAYFAFIRVGQALGYNGDLPPMLAAWLANLVFGAIGALLFWKVTR